MTPIQRDGKWFAATGEQIHAGPFTSNSEAWRWIDRHEGDPISRAEKTSDWVTEQILGSAK